MRDSTPRSMEEAQVRQQLDQLRNEFVQNLNQAAANIRRLEQENQRLQQEMQHGLAAIPEAIERMGAQITRGVSSSTPVPVLIDTMGIGKPTILSDDQEKYG